jgi:Streptomyces sporulation and cell division protein, SsgA
MGLRSSTVTRELTVEVVAPADEPIRVPMVMRYDTADPYALHAAFQMGDGDEVPWVFSRELVAVGVSSASGRGDVRVWPAVSDGRQVVCIALISPDGQALLEAATEDVVDFLSTTYSLCAPGDERQHLDMDGALRALLAS